MKNTQILIQTVVVLSDSTLKSGGILRYSKISAASPYLCFFLLQNCSVKWRVRSVSDMIWSGSNHLKTAEWSYSLHLYVTDHKFSASGREDVDVQMLGIGEFVLAVCVPNCAHMFVGLCVVICVHGYMCTFMKVCKICKK